MMKNTCGTEAFMSAFQALIICLRYPGLTAWAMRYWPFRPFKAISHLLKGLGIGEFLGKSLKDSYELIRLKRFFDKMIATFAIHFAQGFKPVQKSCDPQ